MTNILGNDAIGGLAPGLPPIALTVAQIPVLTHCDMQAPDVSRFMELAHSQMLQSPNYTGHFVFKSTNVLASALDIVVY